MTSFKGSLKDFVTFTILLLQLWHSAVMQSKTIPNLKVTLFGITALISSSVLFKTVWPTITHGFRQPLNSRQYDLRIIVIVYNRAMSVQRLLDSLNRAIYEQDSVMLEIWIDRSKNGSVCEETLHTAKSFIFKHGAYRFLVQQHHVGIYGQWLHTWKPVVNSNEIAVILEDDLTVSPYFYRYLKLVHTKYDKVPYINGYALQGISIKHDHGDELLNITKQHAVYLYPVIGTWGFSPNTRNWKNFVDWFEIVHENKTFNPHVPGNIVTTWYDIFQEQGRSDSLWSIWHIYFAWKHNEYTLYSNFADNHGLSANWKEEGLHYSGSDNAPSNDLLKTWTMDLDVLPDYPLLVDISGKYLV